MKKSHRPRRSVVYQSKDIGWSYNDGDFHAPVNRQQRRAQKVLKV